MRRLVLAVTIGIAFTLPAAAQEKKELTPQQQRMQACNADAKKQSFKDNDARQAFMSSCLKGESTSASSNLTPQQQKMKSCNAEAGKKTFKNGDERKAFMSECLKG